MNLAPSAETAYLFRHALLREAAYQLQAPGDRARLHELAFFLVEGAFGGRAPEPAELGARATRDFAAHPADTVAAELALHAQLAIEAGLVDMRPLYLLYLRRAAEHGERLFQPEQAARHWQSLAVHLAGAARAACLSRAAICADNSGSPAIALDLIDEALRALGESPHRRVEAQVLGARGNLLQMTGRHAPARADYERALSICREDGDTIGLVSVSASLALVLAHAGLIDEAEATFREALEISKRTGDEWGQGVAMGGLAGVLDEIGRNREALELYAEALIIHRKSGNRRFEGIVTGNLALAIARKGDNGAALEMYGQALAIHKEVGNRRSAGVALGNRASLLMDMGHRERARDDFLQSIEIARDVGNRAQEANALENLALLYRDEGHSRQAETMLYQALAIHEAIGQVRRQGTTIYHLAVLHHAAGRLEQAGKDYQRAMVLHEKAKNQLKLAECRCDYGLFLLEVGDREAARQMWQLGMSALRSLGRDAIIADHLRFMLKACAQAGLPPFEEAAP